MSKQDRMEFIAHVQALRRERDELAARLAAERERCAAIAWGHSMATCSSPAVPRHRITSGAAAAMRDARPPRRRSRGG